MADIEADMGAAPDRGESVTLMAPMLLAEDSAQRAPRDPLRLAFPAALAARWMPGLFPDRAG